MKMSEDLNSDLIYLKHRFWATEYPLKKWSKERNFQINKKKHSDVKIEKSILTIFAPICIKPII